MANLRSDCVESGGKAWWQDGRRDQQRQPRQRGERKEDEHTVMLSRTVNGARRRGESETLAVACRSAKTDLGFRDLIA